MFPSISFDASFKTLPNKVFSFEASSFELFEDSKWPCEGVEIGGNARVTDAQIWSLPEACKTDKDMIDHILNSWYSDCKHVFVKPLQLDSLKKNLQHVVNSDYPVVALSPEEENQQWILLWTVTRIEISKQSLVFYWAPTHKKPTQSRILEDFEIQSPEESQYRVIQNMQEMSLTNTAWVQEIGDLPLSDRPALRLQTDLDQAQERARKRLRDARLRAKLAKYRADKMALQFQEKYGYYPAEDEEEAQTEYESSSGDE